MTLNLISLLSNRQNKLSNIRKYIFIMSIFLTKLSWGHGEDKPGPNGGYIRMPGAYHTEVLIQNSVLKIYLLDINWKNPTVNQSSAEAYLKNKETSISLKCDKKANYFECAIDKNMDINSGTLELKTKREGQVGNVAVYDLPLSFSANKKNNGGGHHNHHNSNGGHQNHHNNSSSEHQGHH